MIVKIKRADGWIFLNDVAKVQLQTKDKKFEEVHEFGNPQIIEAVKKNVNQLNLYVNYNNYKQENYDIEGEVYLLNDEGKTVERIN